MIQLLQTLFGGAKAIKTVSEVFRPNAEKSEERAANEQMELLKAYQAEFHARQKRNWIDAIADGFNRLIRPFIATMILGSFGLVYFNPAKFMEVTEALAFMPEGYWMLLSVIIAFYFGGRMQIKSQNFKFKEAQANAISTLIEKRKEFRKLEMENDEPDKLIGNDGAKNSTIEANYRSKPNKIAVAHRKGREEGKKPVMEIAIAKEKIIQESKGRKDTPWPDEMFGEA